MKVFMKYWDCKQCGNKHIEGKKLTCPSCGRTRGTDIIFYEDESNTIFLDDVESKNVVRMGEDWECSYCNSMNRGNDEICHNCGASKAETKGTYEYKKEKINELESNNLHENLYDNNFVQDSSLEEEIKPKNNIKEKFRKNTLSLFITFLLIGFFMSTLFYIFSPKTNTINIVDKQWSKEVEIEKYKTLYKEDWKEFVPTDARITNKIYTFRTTKQVFDHTEYVTETYQVYEQIGSHIESVKVDLGNGYGSSTTKTVPDYGYVTKTRTVPKDIYRTENVYDWKISYNVDRWVYNKTLKTKGNFKDEELWPEISLNDLERVSNKKEYYKIISLKKEKKKEYTLDKKLYDLINIDQEYKVKIQLDKIIEILQKKEPIIGSFFIYKFFLNYTQYHG